MAPRPTTTTTTPTPPPAAPTPATKEQALQAALWYHLGQQIDALTLTHTPNTLTASPHFIAGLSELVGAQLATVAGDVEAFARHDGGRRTVRARDVVVLGRRNEGLEGVLRGEGERVGGQR